MRKVVFELELEMDLDLNLLSNLDIGIWEVNQNIQICSNLTENFY